MDNLDKRRRNQLRKIAYKFNNDVSPVDLLDHLDCIKSKGDRQRIKNINRNDDSPSANRELSSCLVGKTGWYNQLINGLKEVGPEHILRMMTSDSQGSLLTATHIVSSTSHQTQPRSSQHISSHGERRYSKDAPVTEFPIGVKSALSVLDQDSGLSKNWKALADCFGITWEEGNMLDRSQSPTVDVIQRWHQKDPEHANLGNLIKMLETIERFDVVSDIKKVVGWNHENDTDAIEGTPLQHEQAEFCESIKKQQNYERNLKQRQVVKTWKEPQMEPPLDVKDQTEELIKYHNPRMSLPDIPDKYDVTKRETEQSTSALPDPPSHSSCKPHDNRMTLGPIREQMEERDSRGMPPSDDHSQKKEKINQNRPQTKASFPPRSVSVPNKEMPSIEDHRCIRSGGVPTDETLVQTREEPAAATKATVDGSGEADRNDTNLTDVFQNDETAENVTQGSPSTPIPCPVPELGRNISPSDTCTENTSPRLTEASTPQIDRDDCTTRRRIKLKNLDKKSSLKPEDDIGIGPIKSLSSLSVPESFQDILVSETFDSRVDYRSAQANKDEIVAAIPENQAKDQNCTKRKTMSVANMQHKTSVVRIKNDKDVNLDENQLGKDFNSINKLKTSSVNPQEQQNTRTTNVSILEQQATAAIKAVSPDQTKEDTSKQDHGINSQDTCVVNQVGHLESRDETLEEEMGKPRPLQSERDGIDAVGEEGPRTKHGHNFNSSNMDKEKYLFNGIIGNMSPERGAEFLPTNDDDYTNENREAMGSGVTVSQVPISHVSSPKPLKSRDEKDTGRQWQPLRSACVSTAMVLARMAIGNDSASHWDI